jgi:hypothetical protein
LVAVRQIGDVSVAIFEVFHPVLHTVGTRAGISIDIMTSIKDVYHDSRIFLLCKEFSDSILTKQYIIYSHFVTVDCG